MTTTPNPRFGNPKAVWTEQDVTPEDRDAWAVEDFFATETARQGSLAPLRPRRTR